MKQLTALYSLPVVKPTIAGIKSGKDEILERAIEIIEQDYKNYSPRKEPVK